MLSLELYCLILYFLCDLCLTHVCVGRAVLEEQGVAVTSTRAESSETLLEAEADPAKQREAQKERSRLRKIFRERDFFKISSRFLTFFSKISSRCPMILEWFEGFQGLLEGVLPAPAADLAAVFEEGPGEGVEGSSGGSLGLGVRPQAAAARPAL